MNKRTKQGFTLIELLVVVLIIGILASVALPQYKKAVIKSRVAQVWPVLQAIEQAGQAYYLANDGTYPETFADLDLGFTNKNGTVVTGNSFAANDNVSYSIRLPDVRTLQMYTCSSDGKDPIAYATFFPKSGEIGYSLLMCNGKRYCAYQAPAFLTPSITCRDLGFSTAQASLQCFSAETGGCYTE